MGGHLLLDFISPVLRSPRLQNGFHRSYVTSPGLYRLGTAESNFPLRVSNPFSTIPGMGADVVLGLTYSVAA